MIRFAGLAACASEIKTTVAGQKWRSRRGNANINHITGSKLVIVNYNGKSFGVERTVLGAVVIALLFGRNTVMTMMQHAAAR